MAAVGGVAALVSLESYLDPFDDESFDPAVWAKKDTESRMAMARDATSHILAGMEKSEVVKLLGEPGSVEEAPRLFGPIPAGAAVMYSYYLGGTSLSSLRGLDSAFLLVYFGPDGRAMAAGIGGG